MHLLMLLAVVLAATRPPDEHPTEILGAGATFPQPLYEKAFNDYTTLVPQVTIKYHGVGSGAGTQSLLKREVDFAASDVRLSEEEQKSPREPIVQIPTCLGAVAVVVNLPGNPRIRLTPELLTLMFLGRITRWNEKAIVELNPNATLRSLPITVVHRADSSGTSHIFTEFLSKASSPWRSAVGTGRDVRWPVGRGAKGNAGVAGLVRQVLGSIGYVEVVYAVGNEMNVVAVRNRAGDFITPTPSSVSQAAQLPLGGSWVSLTDTPQAGAYPISGFSWIFIYREQNYNGRSREKAERLVRLLWWLVHEGQAHAVALRYADLPRPAIARAEAELRSVQFQGKPLLVPAPSNAP